MVKKGMKPWNKGLTKETDERVKKYCSKRMETCEKRGYVNSKETREKWSEDRKGMQGYRKGTKQDLSIRIKISKSKQKGKNFIPFKQKLVKRIRLNNLYLNWRANIFKRDNYTCQNCFERGCKIEAHHIISFGKMIEIFNINTLDKAKECKALWDEGNGITYCRGCHIMLDKNIGIGLQQARSYS